MAISDTTEDDGEDVAFGVTPTTAVWDAQSVVTSDAIQVGDGVKAEGRESPMGNVALVITIEHD